MMQVRFARAAWPALALAVALTGCSRPHDRAPVSSADTTTTSAEQPSLFELSFPFTDAEGHTRTLEEFRGKPFVASMVYTNCTSVCPRVTADLKTLEKALPPDVREDTRFMLFSLDPGRDTPAALTKFAEQHALDRSRWTLLASSEDDMRTLAAVLGVKFRPEGNGEIAHSAVIVVCSADGVVRHRQMGLQSGVGPLVAAVRDAAR
jgi:protein SCO1/2